MLGKLYVVVFVRVDIDRRAILTKVIRLYRKEQRNSNVCML